MFNKFRKLSWAAAITVLAMVVPSIAQDAFNTNLAKLLEAQPAGLGGVGDDLDIAILVRHVGTGTETSGLVAIDAGTGDLTFTAGALAGETTVDDFECPVSGALGGVIDVSDTACNTIGEVVDTINGTCTGCIKGNWFAVAVDALGSDTSVDALVTISATSARSLDGLALLRDTSTAFEHAIAIIPREARSMKFYLGGSPEAPKLLADPFVNSRAVLMQAEATSTFGSGTSTYQVFSVNQKVSAGQDTTEVVTNYYSQPGGATTVNQIFGGANGFGPYGVYGRKGDKLVAKLDNSAAASAVFHTAYGLYFRYQ